ncbi:methylated-DNA--[protein]-cysteine S-methyltransferase [Paenibacillus naphthalenovorans]|uniref:Methylated-DNA--protein-cysteine methyltransferase n=1 Tax=Paenibacillus naphthalenovorans TaxID=162209 RepID=A0A0U2WCX8_9BACL|nr:methylated-DNA--[protein]-cysteine S-methyltransferase [Paenibacillus naphthalenovorans]ALS24222.1 [Fe-S]-binding protein [Paenibacillus naphthalenovorans]
MTSRIKYDEMESPIGPLTLGWSDKGLCSIEFGTFKETETKLRAWSRLRYGTEEWERAPKSLAEAAGQLRDYFAGALHSFHLPLDLKGTPFQVKVWEALTEIPFGSTRSYKDIAERIGSPKAVRAVGGANNGNPVPIIVPCHRVIGANGTLVGYGGGLDKKTFLLQHEGFSMEGDQP